MGEGIWTAVQEMGLYSLSLTNCWHETKIISNKCSLGDVREPSATPTCWWPRSTPVVQTHTAQEKQNSKHRWSHCWNYQKQNSRCLFIALHNDVKENMLVIKEKIGHFSKEINPGKKLSKPKALHWRWNYLQYKIHLMGLTVERNGRKSQPAWK